MAPLRVFIGYDSRQPLAYNVLAHSIVSRSSVPVAITPLILSQLPIRRRGLTEFTFSRYLVPWLCRYEGRALFLDADMVMVGDVAELFAQATGAAVSVVMSQHPFEWPSLMLFECADCRTLTPEWIEDTTNDPAALRWAEAVGALPERWNHLVGMDELDAPDMPALHHFSQGLPCWPETQGHPEDDAWKAALREMTRTCSWSDLMGSSVHRLPVLRRFLGQRYGIKLGG